MYVPYVYGRQYELLAIRMILAEGEYERGPLLPVVEPVKSRPDDLYRCIRFCEEYEQPIGVVVNPNKHELRTPDGLSLWQAGTFNLIDGSPYVVPTFRCEETTTRRDFEGFLARFEGRQVAVVFLGVGLGSGDVRWLSRHPSIRWYLVLTDHVSTAVWQELPKDRVILIKDCFNRLYRNADYDGQEFFTDRYKTFQTHAAGIGDYLTIGQHFQAGGGAPGAVVIHATYKHPKSGDIWIEHFVSDDQIQGEGDLADKFIQAGSKLIRAVRRRPNEFGSNSALDEYARLVRNDQFPQLGTNKKLQMVHHVCLVLDVMNDRLLSF